MKKCSPVGFSCSKISIHFGVLLILLFLSACKDERVIYINSDGNVKIEFRLEFSIENQLTLASNDNEKTIDREEVAKKVVRDFLESHNDVYAWADLKWDFVGAKRMKFSGVAYFYQAKDFDLSLNAIRFGNKPLLERNDNGEFVVRYESKSFNRSGEELTWEQLSDEKRQEYLKEARDDFNKSKGMTQVLGEFSEDYTFQFQGRVLELDLMKEADRGFRSMTNSEIAQRNIDAVDGNDQLLETLIKDSFGRDGEVSYRKNYALFGEPIPRKARFVVEGDIFNFDKEVAVAQEAFPALMESFGLTGVPEKTEKSEQVEDAMLLGVEISHHNFEDYHKKPFGENQGIKYEFLLGVPADSFDFEKAVIEEIVYDDGSKAILKEDRFREISYGQYEKEEGFLKLESKQYHLPEKEVKGIKSLTGVANFLCAEGSETFSFENLSPSEEELTDIGLKGLKIKKLKFIQDRDGGVEIKVTFNESREMIKELRVFSSNGRAYKVDSRGSSGNEMYFEIDEKVDSVLRFEVECYRRVFVYKSEFKINNIDWFGRPLE